MTRRPKTPRTPRQTALLVVSNIFGAPIGGGFRRQPKGRRAKSGQWAKRTPCPVRMGFDVEYHLARLSSEWRTREQEFRIAIDEIPDDQFHDEGNSIGGVPVRTYRPETTNDRSDKP